MKFDFASEKSNQFKVVECNFLLKEMKYSEKKNYKKTNAKSLNSLQPCTKYNIILTIKNLATSKEFAYENFVTTRPAKNVKIKLSIVEVNSSSVTFAWTASQDTCYVRYQLILRNDKKEIVYDNDVTRDMSIVGDLLPSQAYSAVLIAHDDKGSERESPVENFKTLEESVDDYVNDYDISLNIMKLGSDYVKLMWNISSTDETLTYHLEVFDSQDNSVHNEKLKTLSASVEKLKGCSSYMARISIVGASKIATLPFKTLSAMPSDIRNLILHSSHTSAPMISWDAPEFNFACVTGYLISYKNYSTNATWISSTIESSKTNYELIAQEYGMNVSIKICPKWLSESNVIECAGDTQGTRYLENIDKNKVVVETVREFRLSATEVQLRWDFYSAYDTVLKHYQVFYENEIILTNKTLVNLKTAACNRNYTIVIRCVTNAGNIGPNVTYHLNLNDNELQLSPIDVTRIIVEESEKSLLVSWSPNEAESSCIDHYEVDFRSQHFNTTQPKIEINDFQACMPYQISVTPVSQNDKRGGTAIYEFTTQLIGE
jgi:hypothetical protein